MTYLIRIMSVLSQHGELSITNLAMLSRVNHERCAAMTVWLQAAGLVGTKLSDRRRYFTLTTSGHEYARRMQEIKEINDLAVLSTYEMYLQNVLTKRTYKT